MLNYIEYLGLPATTCIVLVGSLLVMNFVGELLEFKGKVVPEYVKFRKYFSRKRNERIETVETLREVKTLLADVNGHYSADNIAKRDSWIQWVNDRAEVYDTSIVEIREELASVVSALKENTSMTEEDFVEGCRDRINSFASRVGDDNAIVSMEEFHRIFRVYTKYENFLKERGKTNGEIDITYRVIQEAFEYRLKNNCFLENIRGYK